MSEENIIKREDNLTTFGGGLFSKKKGSLILNQDEIYFVSFDKKLFAIPLKSITNVRAQKGFGAGVDCLNITFTEGGKSRTKVIERSSFTNWATLGTLDRLGEPYFRSWETIVEDMRLGRNKPISSFDDIEKLASLKDKGIITEEEFLAKKKQMLGI